MREEDAGGRKADTPLDAKMQLENGRTYERVSRGQASERAVCVCESVSVEKGARRPPLPTAVVCPPGRRRLAITAKVCVLLRQCLLLQYLYIKGQNRFHEHEGARRKDHPIFSYH